MLDDRLRVVFANRAFYSAFGGAPEEMVGKELAGIGNGSLDRSALRGFLDLIRTGDGRIHDYEVKTDLPALGARVLLLSSAVIEGELPGRREILVAIDDATERKRAETTLTSAKWQAERASLSKSRFLAAASHDLRQRLQTLSLMRAILAKAIREKRDEEALTLIARLNETADAMLDMLDTLLDIHQLESGIHPEKAACGAFRTFGPAVHKKRRALCARSGPRRLKIARVRSWKRANRTTSAKEAWMSRTYYQGSWQRPRGYSPVVETKGGRTLWLSGHVGAIDGSEGWDFPPEFDEQVRQAFRNMAATLARAGAGLEHIVTMTAFISDTAKAARFIEIRKEFFRDPDYPCSALIVVAGFAKPAIQVEIQSVAVVDD